MAAIDKVKQFKAGDFLIAFHNRQLQGNYHTLQQVFGLPAKMDTTKKEPVVTSYGAVKKFQVVFVDKHGVPYMKELNKAGKPSGGIITSIQFDHRGIAKQAYVFELDPEFADSIILDDQANFNATKIMKEKADAFKEIAAHNKKIRIRFDKARDVVNYCNTLKVGDTIWRSNQSFWIIQEINKVNHQNLTWQVTSQKFMKVKNQKGEELEISIEKVFASAIYSAQPRTFRELKDPK